MTITDHPHRMDIIEAIRSHSDFGRGSCSVIDECYSDNDLIKEFGFESDGRTVSVKKAVAYAEMVHEVWADKMAEADQYIDRDYGF